MTHAWGGPIDVSPTHLPIFGSRGRVHHGFGFTGNGVGPSYLGGEILARLALDRRDERTRLAIVEPPRKLFPPEPFRYVGGSLIRRALMAKDAAEDEGRRAERADAARRLAPASPRPSSAAVAASTIAPWSRSTSSPRRRAFPSIPLPPELARIYGGDLAVRGGLRLRELRRHARRRRRDSVAAGLEHRHRRRQRRRPLPDGAAARGRRRRADRRRRAAGVAEGHLARGEDLPARGRRATPSSARRSGFHRDRRSRSSRGSGSIDPAHPVLAVARVVLTSDAGAERLAGDAARHRERSSPSALRLRFAGEKVVAALRARGHRRILCEAGPHTFGALLDAGAVDELFLTTSPFLAGDAGRGQPLPARRVGRPRPAPRMPAAEPAPPRSSPLRALLSPTLEGVICERGGPAAKRTASGICADGIRARGFRSAPN